MSTEQGKRSHKTMHVLLRDRLDGEESKIHQEHRLDNIAFPSKAVWSYQLDISVMRQSFLMLIVRILLI